MIKGLLKHCLENCNTSYLGLCFCSLLTNLKPEFKLAKQGKSIANTISRNRILVLELSLGEQFKLKLNFTLFLFYFTSSMVLLCALSGLSLRFQRCDLWLRPPSSSLSVVSCRDTRGRLRLRELIRWRDPGSWSLNQSGEKAQGQRRRDTVGIRTCVCAHQTCNLCPLYQHLHRSPPEGLTVRTPPAEE